MAKKSGENYIFDQISKFKGHKSAKNHWTGTKHKLDLKLIIIHPHTKYQVNISKHSEKKWSQLFYFGITVMGNT
jgi:hypothetical protein